MTGMGRVWVETLQAHRGRSAETVLTVCLLAWTLTGCSGPDPPEMGIIGLNLTFSVAVYSWLIITLVSRLFRKLGRETMVIPQRSLSRQLRAIMVLSTGLSLFLFSFYRSDIYWIFSKAPVDEWPLLQLSSFLVLPIIAVYVLLAYLIILIPPMRRYRPWNLTIVIIIHWLFCAYFFLL